MLVEIHNTCSLVFSIALKISFDAMQTLAVGQVKLYTKLLVKYRLETAINPRLKNIALEKFCIALFLHHYITSHFLPDKKNHLVNYHSWRKGD